MDRDEMDTVVERGFPGVTAPTDTIDGGCEAVPAVALCRCHICGADLHGPDACPACGHSYLVVDGIVFAIGPLTGLNRIAAGFYEGRTWSRFKPWEQLFLWCQGPGTARARRQVL